VNFTPAARISLTHSYREQCSHTQSGHDYGIRQCFTVQKERRLHKLAHGILGSKLTYIALDDGGNRKGMNSQILELGSSECPGLYAWAYSREFFGLLEIKIWDV
jgi:hypothetical protein